MALNIFWRYADKLIGDKTNKMTEGDVAKYEKGTGAISGLAGHGTGKSVSDYIKLLISSNQVRISYICECNLMSFR